MIEAVILALIALFGMVLFTGTSIILVRMALKAAPSWFKLDTKYGHIEISFDNKADE